MWPINAEEPDCQEEKLCDSSYFQYLASLTMSHSLQTQPKRCLKLDKWREITLFLKNHRLVSYNYLSLENI